MPQGYDGLPPFYLQSSNPITANLGLSLKGMDPIVAEDFYLVDQAFGTIGIKINGAVIPNANINDAVPAAPPGNVNVVWQVNGSNVSGYVPVGLNSVSWSSLTNALADLNLANGAFNTTIGGTGFFKVGGIMNAVTGYQVNGVATSGHVLRGNGTNFVDAQLGYSDLGGTPTLPQTKAAIASNWLNSYDAVTGLFTATQPTFADLSSHPTTLSGYGITDAISTGVMTTLGDTLYENASPAPSRLAGNITATKMYLSQTGNGAVSAAPVWAQINYADITGTVPTPPSGSVLWSALGNAAADLTLANGAFNTTIGGTGFFQLGGVLRIGGADAGVSRLAADSLAIGNGTAGDFSGQLRLTNLQLNTDVNISRTAISELSIGSGPAGTTNGTLKAGFITLTGATSNVSALSVGGNGSSTGTVIQMYAAATDGSDAYINATYWGSTQGRLNIGNHLHQTALVVEVDGSLGIGGNDAGISRLGAASLAIGNGTASNTTGKLTLAHINLTSLASYANNAAALAGTLVAGDLYMVTGSDPRQVAIVF